MAPGQLTSSVHWVQEMTFSEMARSLANSVVVKPRIVLGMLVYAWLMLHRFRLQWAEAQVEAKGLDVALAERRAEARADGGLATASIDAEGVRS